MAELLKNKKVMYKIREKIRREISADSINKTQISQLPYLHACVKETLRLHPLVPFLLPHRTLDTCEVMNYTFLQVMNYTIPKNLQVIVNVWAIGRDPLVWEDPKRFVDYNLDFKGQDFEFLQFGTGKRMCLGLPLGTKQLDTGLTCVRPHLRTRMSLRKWPTARGHIRIILCKYIKIVYLFAQNGFGVNEKLSPKVSYLR
ncbi:hypothetical protein LguiB_003624 [Lonicera macranthoides]